MFNLAFVGMLKDQVWLEILKEERYSVIQPNLKKNTTDIKDVFFYFEEAVAEIDCKEVWETVCDVCHFLDIPLDKSWLPVEYHSSSGLTSRNWKTILVHYLWPPLIGFIIHHGHFKIHRKHQRYPNDYRLHHA